MKSGFSLIELLTVLAISALIACFAVPSYQHFIIRAHRLDGQTALLTAANQMEHYFSVHNTYEKASLVHCSPEGWYNLSIAEATETSFMLHAIPNKTDALCQTLTFNQLGKKGITSGKNGSPMGKIDDCW